MQESEQVPTSEVIASRIVSKDLQEKFAVLSGDRNPMHLDPLFARRTQPGSPVVHGIHTLLWALEALCASGCVLSSLIQVRVKLLKWVYVGDEAVLRLPVGEHICPKTLSVEVGGMLTLSAELLYGERICKQAENTRLTSQPAPLSAALNLTFAELANRSGDVFTATAEQVMFFFPHLTAAIGAVALAEIVSCSYVVGMEAPGLHSMFSKLDVRIVTPSRVNSSRAALHYLVIARDERFRKIVVALNGLGLTGTLEAFVRFPPVDQASMEAVATHIGASEFVGMNGLIIGGSRGLGEVTAKMIAAGGGASTITYAVGRSEAERVGHQISEWGARVRVMPYDVRLPAAPQLARLHTLPTHIFYFATNSIFRPKGALVSSHILAEFTAFYLQGFHDLCLEMTKLRALVSAKPSKLVVYYPSSVAVDERPSGMTEYAMVKAAGEQMCRDMNQYVSNLHIVTTRLPRLPTDQTTGVLPELARDPIDVLLPIVREMQGSSSGA
jgi:acyl dehydratase